MSKPKRSPSRKLTLGTSATGASTGPAPSLPSKPQVAGKSPLVTPKPVQWSAIAANVVTTNNATTSSTNNSNQSINSTEAQTTPVTGTQSNHVQHGKKKSFDNSKETRLNTFNTQEIIQYLTTKSDSLKSKAITYKDSGSAWVVNNKQQHKGSVPKKNDDVVAYALVGYLKKGGKHGKNRDVKSNS